MNSSGLDAALKDISFEGVPVKGEGAYQKITMKSAFALGDAQMGPWQDFAGDALVIICYTIRIPFLMQKHMLGIL